MLLYAAIGLYSQQTPPLTFQLATAIALSSVFSLSMVFSQP